MSENTGGLKLLGFYGSLRKDSFSGAILKTVAEAVKEKAPVSIWDISDIPLYNADVEDAGLPESVRKFKVAIEEADGLIISTPEYNYGVSGVLKNALDWVSRPGYQSVLLNKPTLMIASSPAITGGVRAIEQLRQTLSGTLSRIVAVPEIVISQAHTKIENGRLIDETSLRYAVNGVDALLAEIRLSQKK